MNGLRKIYRLPKNKSFTGCDPAVKSPSFGNAYLCGTKKLELPEHIYFSTKEDSSTGSFDGALSNPQARITAHGFRADLKEGM